MRRIDEGAHPDSVLALTFSRKAAEQLRDRVAARVGRTMSASIGSTFHSFAYGLIRRYAPAELYVGPLRLLSAPEQDVVLRELLQDHPESIRWPDELRQRARHPRLRPRGARRAVPGPREGARRRGAAAARRGRTACRSSSPPGRSSSSTSPILDEPRRRRLLRPDPAGHDRGDACTATSCARSSRTSSSTSTRTPTPARSRCCGRSPATAATWSRSATRTSRSTRSAAPRSAASSTSRPTFPHADGRPADVVALGTTRRFGPRILTAAQRVAGRIGLPGSIPEARARRSSRRPRSWASTARAGSWCAPSTATAPRPSTSPTCCAAPTSRTASPGTRWPCWCAPVAQSIPPLRRSLGAAGVPVEVASDEVPLVRDPAALPLIDALRVVLNLDNDDPDHVDHIDAARAEALLTGPLGGLDAGDVRRLARQLRQREKAAGGGRGPAPDPLARARPPRGPRRRGARRARRPRGRTGPARSPT